MAIQHYHKERLSGLLQREISDVIAKEVRDPRISSIITVTGIHLGADMRNATVFVSVYEEMEKKLEALEALNKAGPYIQRIVASRITIKHFPKLLFKIDNSMENSQHINELLKEIDNELG